MRSCEVIAAAWGAAALWIVWLAVAFYRGRRTLARLRLEVSVSERRHPEGREEVNGHRETGNPDIGTPPLIPPPYDAE